MQSRRRAAALLLAIAALAAAALPADAQAPAACPAALTPDQCKACARAAAPAKCHACVAAAKASNDGTTTALTCMVCASLPAAEQELCSSCVKTHGYNVGCSTCAGAALFGIASGAKPSAQGLATAASCFGCYAKASPELQVRGGGPGRAGRGARRDAARRVVSPGRW
jgi:hypothetical protein